MSNKHIIMGPCSGLRGVGDSRRRGFASIPTLSPTEDLSARKAKEKSLTIIPFPEKNFEPYYW